MAKHKTIEITEDLFNHLLSLAKLEVEPSEKEEFIRDMQRIIDFIGIIEKLDLKDVEPMYYPTIGYYDDDILKCTAPDIPEKTEGNSLLKNAPHSDEFYIYVPKFIPQIVEE